MMMSVSSGRLARAAYCLMYHIYGTTICRVSATHWQVSAWQKPSNCRKQTTQGEDGETVDHESAELMLIMKQ